MHGLALGDRRAGQRDGRVEPQSELQPAADAIHEPRQLRIAEQAGQSLVEYSLILCLVVVVLIVVVMLLGNQAQNMYCNISGGIGA